MGLGHPWQDSRRLRPGYHRQVVVANGRGVGGYAAGEGEGLGPYWPDYGDGVGGEVGGRQALHCLPGAG
jgi:hypothetical protein